MIYGLFVLFVVLQAADAAATIWGIRNGLKEANTILGKVLTKLGVGPGLFVMKVPITALIGYLVVTHQVGPWFMGFLVVPFIALAANNLYWILKARGG